MPDHDKNTTLPKARSCPSTPCWTSSLFPPVKAATLLSLSSVQRIMASNHRNLLLPENFQPQFLTPSPKLPYKPKSCHRPVFLLLLSESTAIYLVCSSEHGASTAASGKCLLIRPCHGREHTLGRQRRCLLKLCLLIWGQDLPCILGTLGIGGSASAS